MKKMITLNNRTYVIRDCQNADYYFIYNLLKRNMIRFFIKYWGGWKSQVFRDNINKDNIKKCLAMLRDRGFDGVLSMECEGAGGPMIEKSLRWLRATLKE